MDYYSIDVLNYVFNIHEFLKNRINKSAPFWLKHFPPILESLSTGPTLNECITITITSTLRLYITITWLSINIIYYYVWSSI